MVVVAVVVKVEAAVVIVVVEYGENIDFSHKILFDSMMFYFTMQLTKEHNKCFDSRLFSILKMKRLLHSMIKILTSYLFNLLSLSFSVTLFSICS